MNVVQKMPRYVPHTLQHWTRVIAGLDIRVSARACGIRLCSMAGVWGVIHQQLFFWVVNLYGLPKQCTADGRQLLAVWIPNKRAATQRQLPSFRQFRFRCRHLSWLLTPLNETIWSIASLQPHFREFNCYFLKLQDTEWRTCSNRWFYIIWLGWLPMALLLSCVYLSSERHLVEKRGL